MTATLPCIVCMGALDLAWSGDTVFGQPSAATLFFARGNYGSTVFDPGPEGSMEQLRVNICDRCLLDAARKGLVESRKVAPRAPQVTSSRWDGDGLEWCGRCTRAVLPGEHALHDDEPGSVFRDAGDVSA